MVIFPKICTWYSRQQVRLQADKEGRWAEFADAYNLSSVKKQALAQIEDVLAESQDNISPETLKELAVNRSTTNSFLSTLYTLVKVCFVEATFFCLLSNETVNTYLPCGRA